MPDTEHRKPFLQGRVGWLEIGFLALLVMALGLRLWELDGRTMHYDEAIHLHFAWKLANMEEYIHSPWMHGPFQVEMVAALLLLFGDSDTIARLGFALFGTALVALPYLLRSSLGNAGSFITGAMLAVSPVLLYFSRFGRNDIIMAVWASLLFILMWRYFQEEKDRYLYLSAAVLGFMFATKETAFIVAATLGAIAFLLAIPQIAPLLFWRERLRNLAGPAGFLFLLVTLTLPQWSALAGLFQDLVGLELINRNVEHTGVTGTPVWGGPMLQLPVVHPPLWISAALFLVLPAGLVTLNGRRWNNINRLLGLVVSPLVIAVAVVFVLFRPIAHAAGTGGPAWAADLAFAAVLLAVAAESLFLSRPPVKPLVLRVLVVAFLGAMYAILATPLVSVGGVVASILPPGVAVETFGNALPWNYAAAVIIVSAALVASLALGMAWRGRTWLICAGIFYLVWLTLYTTAFTNPAGAFTGVWQSMGYWVAQQDVARGNQPWYYYFVGLSVYETLPLVFGTLGGLYYLRKGDYLGIVLALWAGLTLAAYTVASEKMPWLLVNITLPFILLAGKYLGDLAYSVRWRSIVATGTFLLPALAAAVFIGGVYLARGYVSTPDLPEPTWWMTLLSILALCFVCAFQVRRAARGQGSALIGLGTAAVLLAFGVWTAGKAAYTFDDSRVEIMAYAQGSADHLEAYPLLLQTASLPGASNNPALVDYGLWYPLQWYLRHETDNGSIRLTCFKEKGEEGYRADCTIPGETKAPYLLVSNANPLEEGKLPDGYRETGPSRDLLWFPESYRRPGEDRQEETMWEELSLDLPFLAEQASSKSAWKEAIDYTLFRDIGRDWYSSEYRTWTK